MFDDSSDIYNIFIDSDVRHRCEVMDGASPMNSSILFHVEGLWPLPKRRRASMYLALSSSAHLPLECKMW